MSFILDFFSAAAGFPGTQGPFVFSPQEQQQYLANAAAGGLLPGNMVFYFLEE